MTFNVLILLSHDQLENLECSFALAGAAEWNKLPVFIHKSSSVSLFKTNLKTYLFKMCYMTRHFSVTRFCVRLFLFRHAINDSLIIIIII